MNPKQLYLVGECNRLSGQLTLIDQQVKSKLAGWQQQLVALNAELAPPAPSELKGIPALKAETKRLKQLNRKLSSLDKAIQSTQHQLDKMGVQLGKLATCVNKLKPKEVPENALTQICQQHAVLSADLDQLCHDLQVAIQDPLLDTKTALGEALQAVQQQSLPLSFDNLTRQSEQLHKKIQGLNHYTQACQAQPDKLDALRPLQLALQRLSVVIEPIVSLPEAAAHSDPTPPVTGLGKAPKPSPR